MNRDVFIKEAESYGVVLDENSMAKLEEYKELILSWNEKINLTAITDVEELYVKHFLDSLSLLSLKEMAGEKSCLDIGSGAGFPGIPLKIVRPDLKITLLDSLNKRIVFLDEVIKALELQGVNAVHGRAEELSRTKNYREKFDIVTARAVAKLNTLCEYAIPFVKVGGCFIAMKGSSGKEETVEAENALKKLGSVVEDFYDIILPGNIHHTLIVIRKKEETGKKYPRGGGKPKNNPL